MTHDISKLKSLPIWSGDVSLQKMQGGLTNLNYLAEDQKGKYVIRVGEDIPVHHVLRFNELAASKAAYQAGLSPKVVYTEPGILVLDYIESQTLTVRDVQNPDTLARLLKLLKRCHLEVPKYLRGPVLMFWVFHVIKDYAATLEEGQSGYRPMLKELLDITEGLEAASQPGFIVFGHNDLLAFNFLDDGARLWLIDWDYAGFNSPLFDLGGLASNNNLDEAQEKWLLENYFEKTVTSELLHQYQAMKCASLLRETLWSMVSEIHSNIDFDYASYSQENLTSFRKAYDVFLQS
ncbi:choline kinase family protein [Sneathiella aquimaris]|uniref:choline kinase family protein n=1 Tax=Sneathiella aquimaris TaxID=2599305 RepID=UPI00146AB75B|nr:choline/ethanolamine kinase family protein [Sneathiella aquimaris]